MSTQGHIGHFLGDKIIYDAQTASGGSGGPLFNSAGKVIAINVAILRDFAGSNFAIPVRFAKRLLVTKRSDAGHSILKGVPQENVKQMPTCGLLAAHKLSTSMRYVSGS